MVVVDLTGKSEGNRRREGKPEPQVKRFCLIGLVA